ncbi:MAG: hypothetical protein HEEMFOPI_01938 [Holosporales bacterium]
MKKIYTLLKKTIKKNAVLCGMLVASISAASAFNECVTNRFGQCQSPEGALKCLKKRYPAAYNQLVELAGKMEKDMEPLPNFKSNDEILPPPGSMLYDGNIYLDLDSGGRKLHAYSSPRLKTVLRYLSRTKQQTWIPEVIWSSKYPAQISFDINDQHCLSKLTAKTVRNVNGNLVVSDTPGESLMQHIEQHGKTDNSIISIEEINSIINNMDQQKADLDAKYKDRTALNVDSALEPQTTTDPKNAAHLDERDFDEKDQRDSNERFDAQ